MAWAGRQAQPLPAQRLCNHPRPDSQVAAASPPGSLTVPLACECSSVPALSSLARPRPPPPFTHARTTGLLQHAGGILLPLRGLETGADLSGPSGATVVGDAPLD
eukprot:SAG25_NODE_1483_length_2932_cov_1.317219_3_plen_105_part_00